MSEESASTSAIMPRTSGVLKGSITFLKFKVEGELPDDVRQKYMARIRTRAFRPLTPEDEDDVSVGWVPIERPFDDEVVFRTDGVFFGEYLNLGLRLDRWKFPAPLVKARMAAAERTWKQKTGKERISRAEKTELRDLVMRKLRREGVPVTTGFDFSWNMTTGELRFFGRSKNVVEHFYELFEKTFSLRLIPSAPYTIGLSVLSKDLHKALATVEPNVRGRLVSDVQQNEGPSIGELIATRRFLGREFIAWLWFETEIFEEKFQIAGKHAQHPDNFGTCEIFIDKVLTLESPGEGAVPQKSALTGSLPGATPEAREALVQGKLPTKARFFVRREEQEFAFTIEGDSLALSAVKIPVVLRTGDDDPFFERMFLVEAIEAAVETLFGVFLELRLRDAWQHLVLPAMRSWMRNEDLDDVAIEEYRGARAR